MEENRKKLIEEFISSANPEVAYSMYIVPHEPGDLKTLSNKKKLEISNAIAEYEELLRNYSNTKEKERILKQNNRLANFVSFFKVPEEINEKASEKTGFKKRDNQITQEAIEALIKCNAVIDDKENFIKILSTDLHRPDLGYVLFKVRCDINESELWYRATAICNAVFEFLAYVSLFKESIDKRDVSIISGYLKCHKSLSEFVTLFKDSIQKLFLKSEEDENKNCTDGGDNTSSVNAGN